MVFINVIIGLLGLGIVVFVHELGHFIGARLAGIDVDAFSIGWGNPVLKKKIGTVEYRIGMFPVGGYCKMKGDSNYNEFWGNIQKGIQPEKGSYFAASPQGRILACLGGPFFNLVFACILLSFLWGIGFEITTLGNRIILASEITSDIYPADKAGLQTGDRIIEIAGKETSYYHEVQENIALNPEKELPILIERNGRIIELSVTPSLDRTTGSGKIGVFFWTDPVINNVKQGSPAQNAGLASQDIITSANGIIIQNTMEFAKVIEQNPDNLVLEYIRNGITGQVQFNRDEYKNDLGIIWAAVSYRTPSLSIPAAIAKGINESWRTLIIYAKSLRLLFMGVDLSQAVSGPIRLTYMIGEVATQGFGQGFGTGLRSITEFIVIISIALCIMNMLPLPIIDGGMIILYLVELICRKPAPPKVISVFQTCGIIIISCLLFLAVFGDISYFIQR